MAILSLFIPSIGNDWTGEVKANKAIVTKKISGEIPSPWLAK